MEKDRQNLQFIKGFTLVELLIAITILSVLTIIGIAIFRTSQIKARDGFRKRDLNTLAIALEIYYQQNNKYITYGDNDLTTCQTDPNTSVFYQTIVSNISDGSVPTDPRYNTAYCYISVNKGQGFRLFASLENCVQSGGNLCPRSSNNYSIYSEGLDIAPAP